MGERSEVGEGSEVRSEVRSGERSEVRSGERSEVRSELREIQKLQGHTDRVLSLAWKPIVPANSTTVILVSCSSDNTARWWWQNHNTSAFDYLGNTEPVHKGTARSCCWSPDGKTLAIASNDKTISIWRKIGNRYAYIYSKDHENEVVSVSCDASGNHLATASGGSVCFFERETYGGSDFDLGNDSIGQTENVQMVQWHPRDESILFSCGYDDGSIEVWKKTIDTREWSYRQTLDSTENGHSSTVRSISFNATGDKMVTSGDDLSIRIWGVERMQYGCCVGPWEHLQTLSGYHDGRVLSVHWSRDGKIASGAADGAICLFEENRDGSENEPVYKLLLKQNNAHEQNINSVQWSPKETGMLASASDDKTVKIWKLTPPQ